MNTPPELQDLVAQVAHEYPEAHLELNPLPSGVCFLRVSAGGRDFVLEYHPRNGTGVSENLPDTPPFVGHDEVFPRLGDAIAQFKRLLANAVKNPKREAAAVHA